MAAIEDMVAQALERSSLSHPAQPFGIRLIGMTQTPDPSDPRPVIWIYGDSFAVQWPNGWVTMLQDRVGDRYRVECRADGGTSISDCCWRFHSDRRRGLITQGHRVVFVWTERLRVFRNQDLHRRHMSTWEDFTMTWCTYPALIRDCVAELEHQGIRCMGVWAFPSSYPGCLDPDDRSQAKCVMVHHQEFMDLQPEEYSYTETSAWMDEIRPALWWYSHQEATMFRREIERTTPNIAERAQLVAQGLKRDQRPNHIGNQAVHERLAWAIDAWTHDQWRGIFDLRNPTVNTKI